MEKDPSLEIKVMEEMMEKSLKRLKTDYVDVLFVHDVQDNKWLTNETILSFLERLKKEGKTRFVGVSLHNRRIFIDVADQLAKCAFYDVFLAWFGDVMDILKGHGIGYSLWEFRGSFGVVDSGRRDIAYEDWHGHKLDRKLLDLLKRS